MHPDKAAGKWTPKRHVSTEPKDHEHPPLPLPRADQSGPVVDGQVVTEPLTKQEKREKAADADAS